MTLDWTPYHLPVHDVTLTYYEAGQGEPLLFLHGGPGDDSGYLRAFAAPLTDHYRCILLDQRGNGGSPLERLDAETLALERFYADIEAIREAIGVEQITLMGHSWGGTLSVYFSMANPQSVKRAIIIGTGPLDADMSAVASANVLKPLTRAEREELATLSVAQRDAAARGDKEEVTRLHVARVKLRLRATFFYPDAADKSFADFAQNDVFDARINRYVNEQAKKVQVWGNLGHIAVPFLIIYGHQDFEPIAQAFKLRDELPNATVHLINQCGHEPWLEQPDELYRAMRTFLQ